MPTRCNSRAGSRRAAAVGCGWSPRLQNVGQHRSAPTARERPYRDAHSRKSEMNTISAHFPTEVEGLPEAHARKVVELVDEDQFDPRIAQPSPSVLAAYEGCTVLAAPREAGALSRWRREPVTPPGDTARRSGCTLLRPSLCRDGSRGLRGLHPRDGA